MLYFYINLPLRSVLKIPSSFPPDQNNLLINLFSPFSVSSHPSSSSFNTYLSLFLQLDQKSFLKAFFIMLPHRREFYCICLTYHPSFFPFRIPLFSQFPICSNWHVFVGFSHFTHSTDLVSLCINVCIKPHGRVSLFQFSENCSEPLGSCSLMLP